MKIVAVNASPRKNHNTDILVQEASRGAQEAGAEIIHFDLYRLEKYTGCISCFGCKLQGHEGKCVCHDGLYPVLEAIRNADGLILGTPNYLSDISAGCRALYERLVFQALTYRTDVRWYSHEEKQVLFIMTSNASAEYYPAIGYDKMLNNYRNTLTNVLGPTEVLIADNTLQVDDYSRFNWTMFDPEAKKKHHEEAFPKKKEEAYEAGKAMAERILKP